MKHSKQNLQLKLQLSNAAEFSDKSAKEITSLANTAQQLICANLNLLTQRLGQPCNLGIAVSGGSDSLALLFVAKEWAEQRNIELKALTVDHGLRPEAALEADYVKDLCKKIDVQHTTLKWTYDKSHKITQENARQARHAFFCKWTSDQNINALLLGHTLDDRLETMMIRQNANSSDYGLAAMPSLSASPIWPNGRNLLMLRPANQLSRIDLQAILRNQNIRWVCDPSNENEAYERVRIRNFLANLSLEDRTNIETKLSALSQERADTNINLKNFLSTHANWNDDGSVGLSISNLAKLEHSLSIRCLERILLCVSGSQQSVGLSRVEAVFNTMASTKDQSAQTHCLGGCWIIQQDDQLSIYPMPTKRAKTLNAPNAAHQPLHPHETVYFQNRFAVSLNAEIDGVKLITWDEASIYGYNPPSPSKDKKARRAMPIAIKQTGASSSPICLQEEDYKVTPLHHLRSTHLSNEIFL